MVIFMILENFLVIDLLVLMNSYGLVLSNLYEPWYCYGLKYNPQQQYHMLRQTKFLKSIWSHRFWRLKIKCIGDNLKMLATVLTISVTNKNATFVLYDEH